jgi:hypothetical protein
MQQFFSPIQLCYDTTCRQVMVPWVDNMIDSPVIAEAVILTQPDGCLDPGLYVLSQGRFVQALNYSQTCELLWKAYQLKIIVGATAPQTFDPASLVYRNGFLIPGTTISASSTQIWTVAFNPSAAITNHINAADPHTQYAKESDLGNSATRNVGTTTGTVAAGDDPRLSDSRTPTGGAGGVLSGNYPNPGFAVDMATQAELDAVNAAKVDKTARGAANGVASLDASGKVPASELPAIAITDVFTVASQAAMLALTAERGDVAVRSDLNKCFALAAEPASTLANWVELRTPTDAVLSVAGKTGAVTLAKADVGLSNVDNTSDANKPVSTAQATAIATATAIHPFLLIGA